MLPVEKGIKRLKLFGELKSLQSRKLNPKILKRRVYRVYNGVYIVRIYFRADIHGP